DRGIEGLLARAGIAYFALPELGNVFRERDDWREPYRRLLERAGDLLAERLPAQPRPLCLLCAERRAADCHRELLAEHLARWGWSVEHLG
ncbi:MAG TPA: DUF488 family protein, partial [Candidatus Polarisedimenticolaceae bacterium]|nr:DUF488 family protein [Candidatus Polarisedimenticolaceae bacterium]